jgi:hypothetical protein
MGSYESARPEFYGPQAVYAGKCSTWNSGPTPCAAAMLGRRESRLPDRLAVRECVLQPTVDTGVSEVVERHARAVRWASESERQN